MQLINGKTSTIRNWKQFGRKIRSRGSNLLSHLGNFPNSILVTGCQRSGTTMISRIITQSKGMTNFWFGKDDELDAALILSGVVPVDNQGRFCFQTTYLNECYQEYFKHQKEGHKVIWVLRNPYSVVYSLLFNWKRFALNELFDGCGVALLDKKERAMYDRIGRLAISRTKRACLAFNGKILQAHELYEVLGLNFVKVIDYEELVMQPQLALPEIYSFIDLEYDPAYANAIHSKSLDKKKRLPEYINKMVREVCEPVFLNAKKLIQ
jgi:hypothetical protein